MHPIDSTLDTKPWYQQFWPWFLIALPASVVVAGFSTLYIANRHADDLVVDEYYKNGLAINRQLEKKQRAEKLDLDAQLQFNESSVVVRVSGEPGDEQLLLTLSHPLEADRDFQVQLSPVGPGEYSAALTQHPAPRWHWTLEQQSSNPWRLDGTVDAKVESGAP